MSQEIDIAAITRSEPEALRSFAKAVTHLVYNMVYAYVQNTQDAEEITQDTLIAALDNISRFKGESDWKTWVYKIALNKCHDFAKYKLRKKRNGKLISLFSGEKDEIPIDLPDHHHPGLILESKEQIIVLMSAINALPEQQKTALVLAKFEQMSINDISKAMDNTPKAVESLLSRARQNLKANLSNNDFY